ncbi:MAG TPA: RNA methyltransferase [Arachnia sp.]|nr:RNA methyltransferase [Arachnia sp.]HMT85425.1 RNA methyltransferase [Arachnia sp.]
MEIAVQNADDQRLRDFVSLRDSQLRTSIEEAGGLFIAEGDKIIRRAAEAGCRPRAFLLQERWLPGLADVLAAWPEVPCYVGSGALIEKVSGFHVHRGALASFHRPPQASWDTLLRARRLLVCEDLVDHANLGGILRIAAGLGWGGVLVSPGAADPLYRRAIKASMGASLAVPWRRMHDDEDLRRLRAAGFRLVAATLRPGAVNLDAYEPPEKVALLLGTEGHGLSDAWSEAAEDAVTIPMTDRVDSLNVATAAAILAYALR